MLRALGLGLAFSMGIATAAVGCEGQAVEFEDSFDDTLGGWDRSQDAVTIDNGRLVMTLSGETSLTSLNRAFVFGDGDICAEIAWAEVGPSQVAPGLLFWAQDYTNYYFAQIVSSGQFGIYRLVNGGWAALQEYKDSPSVRTKAGETNVLRLQAEGKFGRLFINGDEVAEFRGQPPAQGWHIGIRAECITDDCAAIPISIDNVKVTDLPK